MSANVETRVAVLGASGIGRFHVRELLAAGADVVAILGSRPETAVATADELERENGVRPRAVSTLDEILALELDAVTIATPHELHFEGALRALSRGLFVFCEKPLLWETGLTVERARPLFAELSMAGADGRLTVNTSNSSFVEALALRGLVPERPRTFRFRLATGGDDRGEAIAIDLLPHAVSLVRALVPNAPLTEVTARAEQHAFRASCNAGGLAVELELEEHARGEKHMSFAIDDVEMRRVQHETDGVFRVSLEVAGERIEVADPLAHWVARFVGAVSGRNPLPLDFTAACEHMLDTLRLIEASREGAP